MEGDTELLLSEQGVNVLGVPIGQPNYVQEFLPKKGREQDTLFQLIPWVRDPQAARLVLLMCGSTRANFWLRAVAPEHTGDSADRHDAKVWRCLCEILGVPVDHDEAQLIATLSFSAGGFGSFQCVPFSQCRPLGKLGGLHEDGEATASRHCRVSPCFVSVRGCQQSLVEAGLEMPPWAELFESPLVLEENTEPNQPKVGWQRKAMRQVEQKFIPIHVALR